MFSPTATMISPSPEDRAPTVHHPMAPLDLVADADAQHARQLRIALQNWLQAVGVERSLRDDLTLAAYEALANVVEHAYPPDHPRPVMRLVARLHQDSLLITVADQGRWRPPSTEASYRGRGLTVMHALTTDTQLEHTACGTKVHLRAGQR
ncbi:MAG TPA: ATP-binding protein [Pseudonocardiaceae bacterium]|jgi:serine/threonine-protein kinase RsbW|nr:ATP-binding protein [Pseudonocardiaceae bacterium]